MTPLMEFIIIFLNKTFICRKLTQPHLFDAKAVDFFFEKIDFYHPCFLRQNEATKLIADLNPELNHALSNTVEN